MPGDRQLPLRVAILGYGLAGSVFHAPLISTTPGMQVSAIVTGNPERQQQARRQHPQATILESAEAIWREPSHYDLVVIATPNRTHVPLGLAALEAGLPIVVDKPVAVTVADAERLLAASRRSGKLFSVFQNRRWDNDFLTVHKILEENLLGDVVRYESRFDRYRPVPRTGFWRESGDPAEAGGLLYDLGSHLVDQALQLFGRPVSVYAEREMRRPGTQADDDTFIALAFANRVRAHLWMSLVARIPGQRMRVNGLRGTYEKWGLDPQEAALREGQHPGDAQWGIEPREHWGRLSTDIGDLHFDGPVETLPGCYEQYYVLLRDALLGKGAPPVDPVEAIAALRVLEAAQQSAREQRVVTL